MAVPKQKQSKARTGKRKSKNLEMKEQQLVLCSNCNKSKKNHHVCGFCGYYKGKKVV